MRQPGTVPVVQHAVVAAPRAARAEVRRDYRELGGHSFARLVVESDAAAAADGDYLLCSFGKGEARIFETRRWLSQELGAEESAVKIYDTEDLDEVIRKLLATVPPERLLSAYAPEQRVAGLSPEQRVAGLSPEQRVAGLSPEQMLLALPDEVLRALSDAYLDTLSAKTRATIRARIGR